MIFKQYPIKLIKLYFQLVYLVILYYQRMKYIMPIRHIYMRKTKLYVTPKGVTYILCSTKQIILKSKFMFTFRKLTFNKENRDMIYITFI
jgi:hypothetical protein